MYLWTTCDSNKQLGQNCVLNYSEKPCNIQGRTASSQRNLKKSSLVNICFYLMGTGKLVSGYLYEHSSNCVDQMEASNMAEPLSDGYTVQTLSVND